MDNKEREVFWEQLKKAHGINLEARQNLFSSVKYPEKIYRFRVVSESTLRQLQDNTLFYSSANYYDDPFDSYMHIAFEQIRKIRDFINQLLANEAEAASFFSGLVAPFGIPVDILINALKTNPLNLDRLTEQLKQSRLEIQRSLFSICFCENATNETSWLKYADNYKGFALEFDLMKRDTIICGTKDSCESCNLNRMPSILPIYYSDTAYDATPYALAILLLSAHAHGELRLPSDIENACIQATQWEVERISLIKNKCHEHDKEWRMLRPFMSTDRTYIKMKPSRIVLGIKMPEYQRRLAISAAQVAGIDIIEELYIDDSDKLNCRPIRN